MIGELRGTGFGLPPEVPPSSPHGSPRVHRKPVLVHRAVHRWPVWVHRWFRGC